MSKYNLEFKLKVIHEYYENKSSMLINIIFLYIITFTQRVSHCGRYYSTLKFIKRKRLLTFFRSIIYIYSFKPMSDILFDITPSLPNGHSSVAISSPKS